MSAEKSAAERELRKARELLAISESLNTELKMENEKLHGSLQDSRHQVSVSEDEKCRVGVHAQTASLELVISGLEATLTETQDANQKLATDMECAVEKLSLSEANRRESELALSAEAEKSEALGSELVAANEKTADLKISLESALKKQEGQEAAFAALKAQLSTAHNDIQRMSESMAMAETTAVALRQKMEHLRNENGDLKSTRDALHKECERVEAARASLEISLADQDRSNSELESELLGARAKVDEFEKSETILKQKQSDEQQKIARLEDSLAEANTRLEKQEHQSRGYASELAETQLQLAAMQDERDTEAVTKSVALEDLEKVKSEAKDSMRQRQVLESDVASLQTQLKTLASNISDKENECRETELQLRREVNIAKENELKVKLELDEAKRHDLKVHEEHELQEDLIQNFKQEHDARLKVHPRRAAALRFVCMFITTTSTVQSAEEDWAARFEQLEAKHEQLMLVNTELESHRSDLRQRMEEMNVLRRKMHNELVELRGNIRVFCRIRPSSRF